MFAKDCFDHIGDGALFVAPFGESVDTTADQDKIWMANEFVVNSLDVDFAIIEFRGGNFVGYFIEVKRFFLAFEDEKDFVA